ncbi:MAG: protein-tyrosine-phosphatase [Flavobacteriia bacterium]|nr:protein-tyrosine-phosphatase [Flavobacteriia bacterium]
MFEEIKNKLKNCTFHSLNDDRKVKLDTITDFIIKNQQQPLPSQLIFVCTHNSRRSHLSQIWFQIVAEYFSIQNVYSFSAGTEVTALHLNVIKLLENEHFKISIEFQKKNPKVEIDYGGQQKIISFSKTINDVSLPKSNFSCVMTCTDAEKNCPFIPEADFRFSLPYEDPKAFDNTPQVERAYKKTSDNILTEMMYLFSKINNEKKIKMD